MLAILAAVVGAWLFVPAAFAVGVLITLRLRFPSTAAASATTVAALMTNPAASPVIGRPAQLTGKAIGRANPGFIAGEDVIYQDKTGLVTADFRSMLGFIGNLFAGWRRVPKHLQQEGQLTGWFRRSMGGYIIMKELTSTAGVLRARPYFWQAAVSIAVILITAYVALIGTGSVASQLGYESHRSSVHGRHGHSRREKLDAASPGDGLGEEATPEEGSSGYETESEQPQQEPQ
jgi:hypothetical protein